MAVTEDPQAEFICVSSSNAFVTMHNSFANFSTLPSRARLLVLA